MILKQHVPQPDVTWPVFVNPAHYRTRRHPLIIDITCPASEAAAVRYEMRRKYRQARLWGASPLIARFTVIGDLFCGWETKLSQPHRREAA